MPSFRLLIPLACLPALVTFLNNNISKNFFELFFPPLVLISWDPSSNSLFSKKKKKKKSFPLQRRPLFVALVGPNRMPICVLWESPSAFFFYLNLIFILCLKVMQVPSLLNECLYPYYFGFIGYMFVLGFVKTTMIVGRG